MLIVYIWTKHENFYLSSASGEQIWPGDIEETVGPKMKRGGRSKVMRGQGQKRRGRRQKEEE